MVGVAAAIAIAVAAPYLAPLALSALAITATATAIAIATAVISIGLSLAVGIAMKAVGLTGGSSPKTPIGPPTVFRQSVAESFIVYGRRRVGGLMVFFHGRKSGSDHYRYFVIACAGHRCAGNEQFMLNDEQVTVDGTGLVTSGTYANAAWLWFQRGEASETANATFVSECGGKWTANHKGNGTAAIYAKFKMTDDVVQAGMPNITAIIDGKDDIEDPRGPSTGYTNNAALVFYDWMALPREEGGFGAYPDEIPDDAWISAQANVCDETVEAEARYAIDGVITTGAPPSEIREIMVVNCAGTYTYSEGRHLMRVGYWVPSSETLSEDDLGGAIQVSPFMSGDAAANEVSGNFVSPDDGYQAAPFATQAIAATDIRQLSLDLAFITSKYRAERVARIMLNRAQAEKTVIWPMNIAGLKVKAMDTVQLDTARYGLSNYAWTVTTWGMAADFGVVLNLREENSDIYVDPSPVTPDVVPAIQLAETVTLSSDLVNFISTSFITDADPADGLLQGTDVQITIEAHTRTYNDGAVSVNGGNIGSLTASTLYHVYYDDPTRAGGAVTYVATLSPTTAATSAANPGRHYVGSITTDVMGGTGTSSGGSSPPGWDPDNWHVDEP